MTGPALPGLLDKVSEYPLFEALYGRRSRRFGLGFEMTEVDVQTGTVRGHGQRIGGFLEGCLGIAESTVGVRQEHLGIRVPRIVLEDQQRTIFGFATLASRQFKLAKIVLRFPMIWLESNGAGKLLIGSRPATHFHLRLGEAVMGLGEFRVDLQRAAVENQRLGIFSLNKTGVALLEEFLLLGPRILLATDEEECDR